jgi:hypothetical protein
MLSHPLVKGIRVPVVSTLRQSDAYNISVKGTPFVNLKQILPVYKIHKKVILPAGPVTAAL